MPFLIALFLGIYFKNIFYFAIILLIKEFILLIIRIFQIRKFIHSFELLILQNFLFTVVLLFSLIDFNTVSLFVVFIMIVILTLMKPFKFFKKEFLIK